MKFYIVRNAWWMFWARGMVLWPWMWLKPIKTYDQYPREEYADWYLNLEYTLYRHELEHCYQVKRMGRIKFYVSYLWLLAKHGYNKHPYEIEANERENDPLTEQELEWYRNGKVEL